MLKPRHFFCFKKGKKWKEEETSIWVRIEKKKDTSRGVDSKDAER